jgi:hypothetical protein
MAQELAVIITRCPSCKVNFDKDSKLNHVCTENEVTQYGELSIRHYICEFCGLIVKQKLKYNSYNNPIQLDEETFNLLLKIVGDTNENEGATDVIKRLAKFYLDRKPADYQKRVDYHPETGH